MDPLSTQLVSTVLLYRLSHYASKFTKSLECNSGIASMYVPGPIFACKNKAVLNISPLTGIYSSYVEILIM